MSAQVISVGYEKRSMAEFIGVLSAYHVSTLLDVRKVPQSRRKGFSKTALAEHLTSAGITYVHLSVAGNPYYREKNDIESCLARYAGYLSEHDEVIEQVASQLVEGSVAILCYEREHRHCHRSILLDALQLHGYKIDVINVD